MARRKYDSPGQPPKWDSPEKLQKDIDKYFKDCEVTHKPYTIAGLAYALGVSRTTIYNYSYKDEFFNTIKKARDRVMAYIEEQAIIKGNAGTIFIMKNYGYTDKQEIDASVSSKDFMSALGKFADKL